MVAAAIWKIISHIFGHDLAIIAHINSEFDAEAANVVQ